MNFWLKKKLSPEEELRLAEDERQREEQSLDHLKELLETKIETAKIRSEQRLVRSRLNNPEGELKRREEEARPKKK